MELKNLKPEDIIKISASITLILVEKLDFNDLNTLKNILNNIGCNLSCYCTQYLINKTNSN